MRMGEERERPVEDVSQEKLERDWQTWDAQIASDDQAGKLNDLATEAMADYNAGRTRNV